ncbi:MAG: alpha/beta hydrolase [Cryobacterium sp.]|uniref:alpha/beta fold hydrolase n=1 Tax=unclassified Cryobacterium TaxID=2649013 RepID=UPI0018C9D4F1|nr:MULTISPECIES: alpha/beta hydrolase [unclassified Cryobacterium]MCY7403479.1 alpha/beta hydrolase [Cryobacterium sp.]MEC5152719.1 pimeloyl-ACP methyl ester carboxylesterase [Cryobacterium sp. CAN_C3]
MVDREPETNPFALPGGEQPSANRHAVNGCQLYAELRGTGPAILIIGACSDDAEMFRSIAERLTGFTVVTYDARGTLRSSRDGWPCGSAQHADDAAELLRTLGLVRPRQGTDVFGASAGGIVALQLALRHPELVRRVIAYEPGYLEQSESGRALSARSVESLDRHLASHPGDWTGAMAAVFAGLLDAPAGMEWYSRRGAALAENFVRGDMPLTVETVDTAQLARSDADIRFACGSTSHRAFQEIVEELTRIRRRPGSTDPERHDVIDGAGHVCYFTPEPVASFIRLQFA